MNNPEILIKCASSELNKFIDLELVCLNSRIKSKTLTDKTLGIKNWTDQSKEIAKSLRRIDRNIGIIILNIEKYKPTFYYLGKSDSMISYLKEVRNVLEKIRDSRREEFEVLRCYK